MQNHVRKTSALLTAAPVMALVLTSGTVAAAEESAAEAARELALYEADLQRMESGGDYYSLGLVEPLSRIADSYMALELFGEADAILDRAQQIVRVQQGLYAKSQLPFLHKRIENFANAGNWSEARKLQDHTMWLYTRKYTQPDQEMVRGLMDLSYLYMRGIAEDEFENRGHYYRGAARSSRIALNVADLIWQELEQRKVGLLYEQLVIAYLQATAIAKGGVIGQNLRTAYDYRNVAATGYAREIIVSPEGALYTLRSNGVNILERIRRIYAGADQREQSEALAMVKLYQADWYLLFDRKLRALQHYREAWHMLRESGVSEHDLKRFFHRPALLPRPAFYDNIERAIAAHNREPDNAPETFASGYRVKLFYGEDMPALAEPSSPAKLGLLESTDEQLVALFSFDLPAAADVEVRQGWRRDNALGVAQNLELLPLEGYPVVPDVDPLIRDLSRLRFRPALSDGEPRAVEGVISYLSAASPETR